MHIDLRSLIHVILNFIVSIGLTLQRGSPCFLSLHYFMSEIDPTRIQNIPSLSKDSQCLSPHPESMFLKGLSWQAIKCLDKVRKVVHRKLLGSWHFGFREHFKSVWIVFVPCFKSAQFKFVFDFEIALTSKLAKYKIRKLT